MRRVLVIGGDGMLGHQLLRGLIGCHEVRVTLHGPLADYAAAGLFDTNNARGGVDVRNLEAVRAVMEEYHPEVVINAAGIVKQRGEAGEPEPSIEVNALFPHRLARLCREAGAYLIHYSTDCVFSGRKGRYTEDDTPDPVDLYGRSKLLGEVVQDGVLTLRTSMIGPELYRDHGLLAWFLSQRTSVTGYRRAVFSGLTTLEHVRIAERVMLKRPRVSGIYHVSATAISKYDLLCMLTVHYRSGARVVPDDSVMIDRSLDSSRFRRLIDYTPPTWDQMIAELASAEKGKRP